ncbi:MFS transporter [Vibrio mimicus]
MRYNIRKWNPWLISIPDLSVGMFWALTGTIAPWIIYQYTDSAAKVGLLMSMGALTGIFVQVISGIISDKTPFTHRWGKRTPWILGGAGVAAISMLLWPMAPNFNVLFVIDFITYFAVNFFQGPYYTMVMEVVDKDQIGYSNSLARTTAGVGGALISLAAAWIWHTGGAVTSALVIALCLVLPCVAVLPWLVKERPENIVLSTNYKLGFDFIKRPRALQLFFAAFCIFGAYGCLVPMLVPYFNQHLGFSKDTVAFGMTLYSIAGIIYGLFVGRFNDKFDKNKVYLCASGVFLLAIFCGNLITHSRAAFYLFIAVAGAGLMASNIAIYTLLPNIAPRQRLGEYQGLLNLFISLPQFLVMIIMGELIDRGLASYLYPIATIMAVLAVLIMIPKLNAQTEEQASPVEHEAQQ